MSKIVNEIHRNFSEHTVKTEDEIEIYYYRTGKGPLVICSHGFPDNAKSLLPLAIEIANSGFTVFIPYLRGYSPSSQAPLNEYHVCYMAHDLKALIEKSEFNDAFLVGHDWGAQASIGASILFPEMIKKLIVMGWSKPDQDQLYSYDYLKGIWHLYFFQSEIAAEVLKYNNYDFIEKWWQDASKNWKIPKNLITSVKETFSNSGVVEAALAQYRCKYIPLNNSEKYNEQEKIRKGPVKVPSLLLHGTDDREGRLEAFLSNEFLNYFEKYTKRVLIEGVGHFLHQEKFDEVSHIIIEFLKNES